MSRPGPIRDPSSRRSPDPQRAPSLLPAGARRHSRPGRRRRPRLPRRPSLGSRRLPRRRRLLRPQRLPYHQPPPRGVACPRRHRPHRLLGATGPPAPAGAVPHAHRRRRLCRLLRRARGAREDSAATPLRPSATWPTGGPYSPDSPTSTSSPSRRRLRHTWSLAIEEQWYAIWPLLLLVLLRLRRGSLRSLLAASLVMLAASALAHGAAVPARITTLRASTTAPTRGRSPCSSARCWRCCSCERGPLRTALCEMRRCRSPRVACAVCPRLGLGDDLRR